jgi:uracil-DNA glycosylase
VNAAVVHCRACPRLVWWREKVAEEKRAAFRDQEYWGRPLPAFGEEQARVVIVGLAPAAHGGNRTGRIFTGDRSGDWLFRALYRAGFANRPQSVWRDDGLALEDCLITAAARCAPPDNRPTPDELSNCAHWMVDDLADSRAEVVVALGSIAFDRVLRVAPMLGWKAPSPKPRFAHGASVVLQPGPRLLASYHPSQQNTFTGRLTEEMFDAIFMEARRLLNG